MDNTSRCELILVRAWKYIYFECGSIIFKVVWSKLIFIEHFYIPVFIDDIVRFIVLLIQFDLLYCQVVLLYIRLRKMNIFVTERESQHIWGLVYILSHALITGKLAICITHTSFPNI